MSSQSVEPSGVVASEGTEAEMVERGVQWWLQQVEEQRQKWWSVESSGGCSRRRHRRQAMKASPKFKRKSIGSSSSKDNIFAFRNP